MTYYAEQLDFRLQPTGHELEVLHDQCVEVDAEGWPLDPDERERFCWAPVYSYRWTRCSRCGQLGML